MCLSITNLKKVYLKRKLKKKWRFWRLFRNFFLRKHRKRNFTRIKWVLNQKRIIWHQLANIYGKKIKNLIFSNHKTKKIFDTKFDGLLQKLELRLGILLVRMNFCKTLLISNVNILNAKIVVNGKKKHPNYQVQINDLISRKIIQENNQSRLKWSLNLNRWKWRRYKKKRRRLYRSKLRKSKRSRLYFMIKQNLIFNFMEINYLIYWGILIRIPLIGEIVYKNKKRFLLGSLLRKIHFFY